MRTKSIISVLLVVLLPVAGILLFMFFIELHVNSFSENRIFDSIDSTPQMHVGLVPGTSKFTVRGTRNLYYQNRLDAAAMLFNKGIIKTIIVSGDTRDPFYNEPDRMKQDLIEMGIPEEKIMRDDEGNRTLNSVLNAKNVIDSDSILFISQKFHNQRALYLAAAHNIEMWAFNATDVSRRGGLRTQIRERFARIKAVADVHFLNLEVHSD